MTSRLPDLPVLFGTQSGNARRLAGLAATVAKMQGLTAEIFGLDTVRPHDLAAIPRCLVICSSYGEGEMPANARGFWKAFSHASPDLSAMRFALLALGDRSYDTFCQAGRELAERFTACGAQEALPRFDSDLDTERRALRWLVEAVIALAPPSAGDADPDQIFASIAPPLSDKPLWHQRRPYPATVTGNRRLSGPGSNKDVRHVTLDLGESGLAYQPGDSLGIRPLNDPVLVEAVIDQLGAARYAPVPGRARDLATLLASACEIGLPSPELTALVETHLGEPVPADVSHDVLSLLQLLPRGALGVGDVVGTLKALRYRSYSIASSPLDNPASLDLTVGTVRWRVGERAVGGVCSVYLADRLAAGTSVGVFVSPNPAFHCPPDPSVPLIMIGPGTGIAPFRAFLHHRRALGATGRNWLFFGDLHRADDFLYREELDAMQRSGLLTRLDLAFSRDQPEKRYVQHLIAEQADELHDWIEAGAVICICGARKMAQDVMATLDALLADRSARTTATLDQLKAADRLRLDVY